MRRGGWAGLATGEEGFGGEVNFTGGLTGIEGAEVFAISLSP